MAEEPALVRQAPSDVLRLAVSVVLLLATLLVGALFGEAVVGFASDLLRGLDRIPAWLVATAATLAQAAAVVLVVLAVGVALRRRAWLLLGALAAAAAIAAALTAGVTSLADATGSSVTDLQPIAAIGEGSTWSAAGLAAIAAVIGTVSPWVSRRWRRFGWAVVMVVALVHFGADPVSFDSLLAILVGWVVSTAITVVVGSPSHRPTAASISAGLGAVGVPMASLEPASVDARGSTPYFGEEVGGRKLFVKALGNDERSADLMFRVYRRLQRHELGDEKPFSTLRRAVEHEALVAYAARDIGVRTPRLVAFATAEPNSCVLAYEAIAGRSLDRLEAPELTDEVLDAVWSQLAMLRAHRVAHRDLRLANVFLADDGEAWIIDFGFSEIAASDLLLATDLAEMICSSATVVGPERAVAAAVRGVGEVEAATARSRLQLPMLSGATRTALKADPATWAAIQAQVGALSPAP
ncbi:MAG: phosphotransferase [Acidimicrobiales bacterium]